MPFLFAASNMTRLFWTPLAVSKAARPAVVRLTCPLNSPLHCLRRLPRMRHLPNSQLNLQRDPRLRCRLNRLMHLPLFHSLRHRLNSLQHLLVQLPPVRCLQSHQQLDLLRHTTRLRRLPSHELDLLRFPRLNILLHLQPLHRLRHRRRYSLHLQLGPHQQHRRQLNTQR